MALLRTLIIASLAAGATHAAQAADLITMPVSSGTAEVPVHDGDGFDWTGFYAGIYGIGHLPTSGAGQLGLGVDAGVNAQLDFFLVGGEVALHGLSSGGSIETAYGQVTGRAGVLISDEVLLYAAAGYGLDLETFADDHLLLGGGVEVAVTDELSLRAQYLHGVPLSGGTSSDQITFGANFHF